MSYTIRHLPHHERPRERLQQYGAKNLSLHELWSIVLGSGSSKGSVLLIAQRVAAYIQSCESLGTLSIEELQHIPGIGAAQATKILALFEIARRTFKPKHTSLPQKKIQTPNDIFSLLKETIGKEQKEHVVVLSCDARNRIIHIDTVSIGTLTASLVHPREVFTPAIRHHAASIVLAHNHPSGHAEPSEEDTQMTKRIAEVGELMGIDLLDHLIVTDTGYYSFRAHGIISK